MKTEFRLRTVAFAVANVFGTAIIFALGSSGALAQEKVERVEITGSLIKRIQGEGPAPVETYTRQDIERTKATNVNELLRAIPSIDIYDQGELASNSPAGSGTAIVRMRGLADSNVLVLLNGRRLPINALYDSSGAGAAVDINMIPIAAIERIEILKDGGSAIYGADAVAGVVNFITKKDYRGFEVNVGYGTSSRSDGTEKTVNLAGGFGDLNKDGYNVMLTFNDFQRDPILRKDRDISKSVDFRPLGGRDSRSSFSPAGNFVDPDTGAFTGGFLGSCPPENLSGGRCRYDFNASLLTAYNGADRQGAMAVGTLKISPNIRGFAEVFYGQAKDHFDAHPVPDYFTVSSGTGLIAGRFMQGGPRITDRESTTDNVVVGLEGNTGKYDWKVAVGQGRSKVTNRDQNYYNQTLWTAATESGAINPTVNTNDTAFVESLKVRPLRIGESKVQHIDAQVSGDLMQMAGGPLAYAVGASFWKESLVDTPDPLTQAGLVAGSIAQAGANASRNANAIFGEVNIPVIKNLEVQAALRYDDYRTVTKTSPKVAARWQVLPALALRASYTESFRMPALKQLFGAQEQGAVNINNDTGAENCQKLGLPATCDISAFQVNGSNADLKPEKGKTWNIGAAFEVGSLLFGTVDFWRIEKSDTIDSPSIDQAMAQGLFARDAGNTRWLVFTNLQNFAKFESEGVDINLRARIAKTPVGTLSAHNLTTRYSTARRRNGSGAEWETLNDTYRYPKMRNTFGLELENGPWTGTMAWRWVDGFYDTDVLPTATKPIPDGTRRVSSYDEVDLFVSYAGFRNFKLDFGIKNLLDSMPPFSQQNASSNAYTQMGFAELYTSRGRFYFLNAKYTFK